MRIHKHTHTHIQRESERERVRVCLKARWREEQRERASELERERARESERGKVDRETIKGADKTWRKRPTRTAKKSRINAFRRFSKVRAPVYLPREATIESTFENHTCLM